MLSRSQAKTFFVWGTVLSFGVFFWLTVDTFMKVPTLTNQAEMNEDVIRGKHLWDVHNCMGCHTLLGEGGYYAPELTKVYERRGPQFIRAMLEDPEAMYPGQRRMFQYDLTDAEIDDFIAFFEWVGTMDLNGFPPEPVLFAMAGPGADPMVQSQDRPKVYNQMCIACHALGGQGGAVGPALDGIGDRMSREDLEVWLKDPAAIRPGTAMPKLPLSEDQIRELGAFLSTAAVAEGSPLPSIEESREAAAGEPQPEPNDEALEADDQPENELEDGDGEGEPEDTAEDGAPASEEIDR